MRDPEWRKVQAQFRFGADRELAIQRLTRVWTDNFGLVPVNVYGGSIAHEMWPAARIGQIVDIMAETPHRSGVENRMRTSEKPKFTQFPLVAVRTQGREFLIDGRRRANLWRKEDGEYPVLVIEVAPRRRARGM